MDATSAAVITRRCNPYGHETGGPRHLLGGIYSAAYEGRQKWHCENPATLRVRMECENGHRGQVMDLCQSHAVEIQRRQSDLCPPCAFPPEARQWHEVIERSGAELGRYQAAGMGASDHAIQLARGIEEARVRMNELTESGRIRKVPLILREVS
jgi:hypothetical protein